jgi:hypothetical protein
MSKRIVKLNGGLGNQMFQFAFSVALQKTFGGELVYDFSFFSENIDPNIATKRTYELNEFNIDCNSAEEEDMGKIEPLEFESKLQKRLWKIFQAKMFRPKGNEFVQKASEKFYPFLFEDAGFYYYNGYFQNEQYFQNVRKELLEKFSLKNPIDEKNQAVLNEIKSTNSISLHVRRGDYVTLESASAFHGVCGLDYYKKAIDFLSKKIENPHFFIFSDDMDWVKENLKINFPCTYVDFNGAKGWLDMNLMKNCKHNIVANSSFSWWGAWLNENQQKIVIAPKIWFAQKPKVNLAPKNWVKM